MKPLLCFARGRGDQWEAICLDLDIAVQGRSYEEVYDTLHHAVLSYVEDAKNEGPDVARQLLRRKAPWYVRAKYVLGFVLSTILAPQREEQRHGYTMTPCPA